MGIAEQPTHDDTDPKEIQEGDTAPQEIADQADPQKDSEQDSFLEPIQHPSPVAYAWCFASELRINLGDLRREKPGVYRQLVLTGGAMFVGGVAVGAGATATAVWLLHRNHSPSRAKRLLGVIQVVPHQVVDKGARLCHKLSNPLR